MRFVVICTEDRQIPNENQYHGQKQADYLVETKRKDTQADIQTKSRITITGFKSAFMCLV